MSTFTNHPVMKEMFLYGSTNEAQTMLAFTTYLQFCEGKYLMWNVEHKFLSSLNLIIITASKKNNTDVNVYLPISSQFKISPQWMQHVNENVETLMGTKEVHILICDGDSKSVGYTMQSGFSPITDNSEEKSCKKQMNFTKEKLFKKYAPDIHKVATMNNVCTNSIDYIQNENTVAQEFDLPEQENIVQNITDDTDTKNSHQDFEKKQFQNKIRKETNPAEEIKNKGENNENIKSTEVMSGPCDVLINEKKFCKEKQSVHHSEEICEKAMECSNEIELRETTGTVSHENNISNEKKKHNKDQQKPKKEKSEEENKVKESRPEFTDSEKASEKNMTHKSNKEEANRQYNRKRKNENSLIDEKVRAIEHVGVSSDPDESKEMDDSQGKVPNIKVRFSEKTHNSVVSEISKEKKIEEIEHEKEGDKTDKNKTIDVTQGKVLLEKAREPQKKDNTTVKDNFDQNVTEKQSKKVVAVAKEKDVSKISNQKEKIQVQEIVDVLSTTEEETSDDENSDDNSCNDEDESEDSDIVEVSDDSSDEEIRPRINKTLSSCTSETSNSSSDSDIEEIRIVKTSPEGIKRNIDQNKKNKFNHRYNSDANSKTGDDLEVLYEIDDKKSLFASQIVEVVYTNSLDTDFNASDSSHKSENTDDAVEIIFEKERNKKKRRKK